MLYWVFATMAILRFTSQAVNNLFGFALAFCTMTVQDVIWSLTYEGRLL